MRDLSNDARALLEAYSEHNPAPALDEVAFEPDATPRWRGQAQGRATQAAVVASALAAAAVATIWLVSSSTRGVRDADTPRQQAPHQRESATQHEGTVRDHRAATPATAPKPNIVLPADPAAPAAPTAVSDAAMARKSAQPATALPAREPARAVSKEPAHPVPKQPPDALAAELRLLDAARAALERGDVGTAIQELAQHKRRFPSGTLAPERTTLERAIAEKKDH